jgi:hypothetical protein
MNYLSCLQTAGAMAYPSNIFGACLWKVPVYISPNLRASFENTTLCPAKYSIVPPQYQNERKNADDRGHHVLPATSKASSHSMYGPKF